MKQNSTHNILEPNSTPWHNQKIIKCPSSHVVIQYHLQNSQMALRWRITTTAPEIGHYIKFILSEVNVTSSEYFIIKQMIKQSMCFEEEVFMQQSSQNGQKVDASSTAAARSEQILFGDSWVNEFLMSPFGQVSDSGFNHLAYEDPLPILASLEIQPPLEYELLFPDKEPPEKPPYKNQINVSNPRKNKQKKKGTDELKNFLCCIKRCLLDLVGEELSKINSQAVARFLEDKKKTNKLEFQQLFKNQEARTILEEIFLSDALHRQIQLSMMRKASRKVFLNQLYILKKAFIEQKLPNLSNASLL